MMLLSWIMIVMFYFEISTCSAKKSKEKTCQCGLRNKPRQHGRRHINRAEQTDIVHPPNKYPWMISLYQVGKHYCEGSIISDYYVLTAAHCVLKRECLEPSAAWKDCYIKPKSLLIFFVSVLPGFGKNVSVQTIVGHPRFRAQHISYDIALLRTKKKIPCSKITAPICLPTLRNLHRIHHTARIAAWGESQRDNVPSTKVLQEAQMKIQSKEWCEKKFKNSTKTHFCATGNWQNACKGASGGPIFVKHKGHYYAIGVTSAGSDPDCGPSSVEYFAMVQKFLPWIQRVTKIQLVGSSTRKS